MSRVDIPNDDALFLQWIDNFSKEAAANATALGLTTGQTTTLTTLSADFATAYSASQTGKVTAKGLVATKNTMRLASEAQFRSIAKVINANPNIASGLKADLGINMTPAFSGPVVTPTNLVVTGYENGENVLVWNRSGNAKGTAFVVEAMVGEAASWSMISTVTKLKFVHTGQIPGQKVSYRVYAKRGDFQSSPCASVPVYDNNETPVLMLKTAA